MTGDFFNDITFIGGILFGIFSFYGIIGGGPFLIIKMFKYLQELSIKPEDNFFKRTVIKFAKLFSNKGLGPLYYSVLTIACLFVWLWLMDILY